MSFVDWPQQAMGFTIRKQLGLPNQLGWHTLGWSELGDDNIYSGVYQQRHSRKGTIVGVQVVKGQKKNFVMRPYWPSQPASEKRDQQQLNFFFALISWQSLTDEEKNVMNKFASRRGRRGYDYFMSEMIKIIIRELG